MATLLIHNPEYSKYKIIPKKTRDKLLNIRTQVDVRTIAISCTQHSTGGSWRLRWLDSDTGKGNFRHIVLSSCNYVHKIYS